MTQEKQMTNPLGTDRISTLVARFAVPSIIGGYLLGSGELCKFLACHGASPPLGCSLAPRNLLSMSILYNEFRCMSIVKQHFS